MNALLPGDLSKRYVNVYHHIQSSVKNSGIAYIVLYHMLYSRVYTPSLRRRLTRSNSPLKVDHVAVGNQTMKVDHTRK